MTWEWRIKELAFLFFGKSFSPLGSLDLLELLVAIGRADCQRDRVHDRHLVMIVIKIIIMIMMIVIMIMIG